MLFGTKFEDRQEAGVVLGRQLSVYANRDDVIVLALPRGGVPVGFEVAKILAAPMDVFVVRKLGVPGREEFAFGAIASGGIRVLNEDIVKALRLPDELVESITAIERAELERREKSFRGQKPPPDVRDRIAILVDDGLATGATMRAAVKALKTQGPRQIVVAVPVASRQACEEFKEPEEVWSVCSITPEPFYGVGMWYQDFRQTTDDEVKALLKAASSGLSKTAKT